MSYISADDIKSYIIKGINLSDYLDECDKEIVDLAEIKGIRDSTLIKTTPLHHKIKRYAVVYICMRVAQDKRGTAGQDMAYDLYDKEYDAYKIELKELFHGITYEMLTGTVNSISARTSTSNLYRS